MEINQLVSHCFLSYANVLLGLNMNKCKVFCGTISPLKRALLLKLFRAVHVCWDQECGIAIFADINFIYSYSPLPPTCCFIVWLHLIKTKEILRPTYEGERFKLDTLMYRLRLLFPGKNINPSWAEGCESKAAMFKPERTKVLNAAEL